MIGRVTYSKKYIQLENVIWRHKKNYKFNALKK